MSLILLKLVRWGLVNAVAWVLTILITAAAGYAVTHYAVLPAPGPGSLWPLLAGLHANGASLGWFLSGDPLFRALFLLDWTLAGGSLRLLMASAIAAKIGYVVVALRILRSLRPGALTLPAAIVSFAVAAPLQWATFLDGSNASFALGTLFSLLALDAGRRLRYLAAFAFGAVAVLFDAGAFPAVCVLAGCRAIPSFAEVVRREDVRFAWMQGLYLGSSVLLAYLSGSARASWLVTLLIAWLLLWFWVRGLRIASWLAVGSMVCCLILIPPGLGRAETSHCAARVSAARLVAGMHDPELSAALNAWVRAEKKSVWGIEPFARVGSILGPTRPGAPDLGWLQFVNTQRVRRGFEVTGAGAAGRERYLIDAHRRIVGVVVDKCPDSIQMFVGFLPATVAGQKIWIATVDGIVDRQTALTPGSETTILP